MPAVLFTRRAVIPVWVIIFGLVAVFAPPSGLDTRALLLVVVGLVVPVITLVMWRGTVHPTIAEPGLQPQDVAMVGRVLKRRRGPRRRDEGRL